MPRQRLRPDWSVSAYKFWIQPVQVPQRVWDTATQMQALWNQLVDLCDAASARISTVEPKLDESDRKAIYTDLDEALKQTAKRSAMKWDCREFILDKFKLALQRALERIRRGVPPGQAGFPKRRSQLRKIMIPHRYTRGGVPISKLFKPQPSNRTKRFWLKPVDDRAYLDNARNHRRLRYTEGFFGLRGVKMPIRILIHRQIPNEALVKNILLIGNHSRHFGWEWAIALICELPPITEPIVSTGRHCGLDLGWRKFDTYLRIGMLVDNTGRVIELRLPLDMSNRRSRNFNQWIERASRPAADKIHESWEDLREAVSSADESFELVKLDVAGKAQNMELPDHIRASRFQIAEMRQAGFLQLLRSLQEASVAQNLQDLILEWKTADEKVQRRIHSARLRLTRRRQSLYQNLAGWMAKNYDIISWEADLGIKWMAEDDHKSAALKRSDRNRQIAAIGEFKRILKHQSHKRRAMLLDGEKAYSTVTCFTCGQLAEGGAQLVLQCPNGHRFDQDENAARWFLSAINQEVVKAFDLRQKPVDATPQRIEIPGRLRSFAA